MKWLLVITLLGDVQLRGGEIGSQLISVTVVPVLYASQEKCEEVAHQMRVQLHFRTPTYTCIPSPQ